MTLASVWGDTLIVSAAPRNGCARIPPLSPTIQGKKRNPFRGHAMNETIINTDDAWKALTQRNLMLLAA